jgi:hypothetical protein
MAFTMKRWGTAQIWFKGLFLVGMLLLLASCGTGGEGCGGIEDIVSCVTVTRIEPDMDGIQTSNVDAFQDTCPDLTPEPFTDHNAVVTFANAPFPAFPEGTDSLPVTIKNYRVSYTLNGPCPGTACPPLPPLSAEVTISVPANQTVSATFPLVPIQSKRDYEADGGDPTAFPSYTANYVFTAQTDFFQDTFTIAADVPFTIGDFDNCQ